MPLDPYFTASDKTLQDEIAERRLILAETRKKPKRVKVLNRAKDVAKKLQRRRKSGSPTFITGKPSLTGFKPPKKIWDEKR